MKKYKSKLILVKHDAIKRGSHYDIRLKSKEANKWHSWALVYDATEVLDVPENSKDAISAIKTHIHSDKEANFFGTIPEGEYGAGELKKVLDADVEVETDEERYFKIFFLESRYKNQIWILYRMRREIWILFRKKEE